MIVKDVNQNPVKVVEVVPVVCRLWLMKEAQCVLAPALVVLGQAVVVLTGNSLLLEGGLSPTKGPAVDCEEVDLS